MFHVNSFAVDFKLPGGDKAKGKEILSSWTAISVTPFTERTWMSPGVSVALVFRSPVKRDY